MYVLPAQKAKKAAKGLLDGIGDGPVNKHSLQIPLLLKVSTAIKQAVVVGDGKGVCGSERQSRHAL